MVRAFIALELSPALQEKLGAVSQNLASAGADVRWVEPGKIHLTLKFLGEVSEEQIPKIKAALDPVAARFQPFQFHAAGVGVFPHASAPRVLWVGIEEAQKAKGILQNLAKEVEKAMEILGFHKEERPFSPHLTIGRVRTSRNLSSLAAALQKSSFQSAEEERADRIILFQSTLTPTGPVYQKLHETPFPR